MIRLACADLSCDGPKMEGKDDKNEKKRYPSLTLLLHMPKSFCTTPCISTSNRMPSSAINHKFDEW